MPFAPAAQPDIVRASQKDDSYSFQVFELVQDAVRRILGPRRAILCSSETELVSGILYYVLTTGCGSQTLGEEYCDILQTTGTSRVLLATQSELSLLFSHIARSTLFQVSPAERAGLPERRPSTPRRLTLVTLDTLGPYLAEKLQQYQGTFITTSVILAFR